jgi:hypothetical protein
MTDAVDADAERAPGAHRLRTYLSLRELMGHGVAAPGARLRTHRAATVDEEHHL